MGSHSPNQATIVSSQQRVITAFLHWTSCWSQVYEKNWFRQFHTRSYPSSFLGYHLTQWDTSTQSNKLWSNSDLASDSIRIIFGDAGKDAGNQTWILMRECLRLFGYIQASSQGDAYRILYFKRNYITVRCYGALSGEVSLVFACLVRGRAACSSSLMQSSSSKSK